MTVDTPDTALERRSLVTSDGTLELSLHVGVVPVEIRLLAREQVEVPLTARLVSRPRRASEFAEPIVGWCAIRFRIAPHVPISLRISC